MRITSLQINTILILQLIQQNKEAPTVLLGPLLFELRLKQILVIRSRTCCINDLSKENGIHHQLCAAQPKCTEVGIVINIDDPASQLFIFKKIISDDLSVRAVESMARELTQGSKEVEESKPEGTPKEIHQSRNCELYRPHRIWRMDWCEREMKSQNGREGVYRTGWRCDAL